MIVELGNGYRIDGSDGMNWTLTCDIGQKGDMAGKKLKHSLGTTPICGTPLRRRFGMVWQWTT